jgi:hypothetical protein
MVTSLGKVTRDPPFYLFFIIPSKQTKHISHNHHGVHITITYIIETTYLTNTTNITSISQTSLSLDQVFPTSTSFINISITNIHKNKYHKFHKHSFHKSPLSHYRNRALCRVPEALGKVFVECDTRQRKLGEQYISNDFFAEYFLSGTRQRLCRVSLGTRQRKVVVTTPGNGDGAFAECSR